MAAKKKNTSQPALPKGFVPVRSRLDGFFELDKGNSITGILRGSFTVQGKFGPKAVYRIEVTDGETQVGDGELVSAGAIVGLDERGFTKSLADLEAGTMVFVRYNGLRPPQKGDKGTRGVHLFDVGRLADEPE